MRLLLVLTALVLAAVVAGSHPSRAAWVPGQNLHQACADAVDAESGFASGQRAGFCLGYVAGVADMMSVIADLEERGMSFPSTCIQNTAALGHLKDVVKSYLAEHPDESDYLAITNVMNSLMDAFPCDE